VRLPVLFLSPFKAAAEQRAARARAVQAETKNAMSGGPPRVPVVTENPEQRAERLAKELIEVSPIAF
jgi:hypothetical protein